MAAYVKENLKLAKQSIQAGNLDQTVFYSECVLENDPHNYNALLFLGKAQEGLNEPAKSFDAYNRATKEDPLNPLAWKGLLILHESQKDLIRYLDAFVGIVKCYEEKDDLHGAGDALLKTIKLVKLKGNNEVQKRFLQLQLPESPIFDFLEPRLPKLPQTLSRLIKIHESEEKDAINKTVSKQKVRIGKKTSNTADTLQQTEAKYKIYKNSPLPGLYNSYINTTHDDDERRMTEGKLLRYIYNLMRVAPPNEKPPMKRDATEMASGLVVVRSPEPLAWKLDLDWQDPVDLKDIDYETVVHYTKNFTEPSARVLLAFLNSEISPFPQNSEPEPALEDDNQQDVWTPVTVLETISDGFENDPEFVLSYRVLGQIYLRSQEYESAADIARKGLSMIKKLKTDTLVDYNHGAVHLMNILGTAYTYYQAPKNFNKAVEMFDKVLAFDPKNVHALVGKGLIFLEKGQHTQAEELLKSVYVDYPDNFEALFELSWCQILEGNHVAGQNGLRKCLDMVTGSDPESLDYRAKIWWRIGHSYWTSDDEGNETEAFNAFVKSLHENPNFAPAYTSLGVFYSDHANDKVRASKCFYKAFELDAGEIDAAQRLATEFADNSEWGLVEVVASRTIESERLRTFSNREASWPYRALGIVGLNKRDYAQAVQYFQRSLRLAPRDADSWIGLGEAYTNSGRYVAAAKAFDRALLLDPENWIAQYQLGIVKREVMAYEEAISAFEQVLQARPSQESSVKTALIDTYLLSARYNLKNEFYSQSVDQAAKCVEAASKAILEDSIQTQDMWKAIGDACEIFLSVDSQEHKAPMDVLVKLLFDDNQHHSLVDCAVAAFAKSLDSCRQDMSSRAMTHYNLGLVHLKAFVKWGGPESHREEAIGQLKKAIQLEHRNADFWNAYGIASSTVNVRVAQHCFIRSLSFNIAQPDVWANLGALYLLHGDVELAEESFEKTQAIDPEYVQAWVGQGIVESTKGNTKQANSLFDQSFLISNGSDGLAKLLYGLSVLERAQTGEKLPLETGVLALQKFLMVAPKSDLGLTIQGMLLERENSYEYAIEHIDQHCSFLEEKYESTEDYSDLVKFAKAKAQLARLHLGAGNFDQAIEHADFAIDVAHDDESLQWSVVVSAVLTAGLSHYFSGSFDEAIECFKRALELTDEDQDVVVLLAQVLWAHGGEQQEVREVALDQLYSSVGSKGASLKITLLLGAIGLVDDSDLVEAAREELESLSLDTLKSDRENHVQEILSLIKQSNEPWQRAAYLWPSNYKVWKNLDQKVALQLAKAGSVNDVTSTELSDSYTSEQTVESSQRAVFYAPWNVNAWSSLAKCLS